MSRERVAILIACCVVIIPRLLWWGQIPIVVDGDEAGFFATGVAEYAHRSPLWSLGPNSLPNAHFWLMGLADALLGRDVWSARLITAVFGGLQALALVAASARLTGAMGALTTATVLCLPLELHFERLNMCNVWTTATWSLAFAVAVLAGWRVWAGALVGVLLAAGWYGYQSSRLVPVIVAAPLLVLLVRATRRQVLVIAAGVLGFLVTLSPLLYGFWLAPQTLLGRGVQTSWISSTADAAEVQMHLSGTLTALSGTGFDNSAFLPYHVPLFPLLITLMALAGLLAARSLPLALVLGAWFGWVVVGNFARNIPIYSCVLICAVPAAAVAAGLTARFLGVAAPLLAALAVFPATSTYYDMARRVPPTSRFAMANYRALKGVPYDAPLMIGGGVGCGHGFTQIYRKCIDLTDATANTPRPPGAYVVLLPEMRSLADSFPGDREYQDWDGIEVVVIQPPPAGAPG
jgi:hypothetical protein